MVFVSSVLERKEVESVVARVIYYWLVSDGEIYLLNLYAKNEQSDLTADQKKDLRKVVEVLSG